MERTNYLFSLYFITQFEVIAIDSTSKHFQFTPNHNSFLPIFPLAFGLEYHTQNHGLGSPDTLH